MKFNIPRLYRSKFSLNSILDVTPAVRHYSAGFYIEKGSMKGIMQSDNEFLYFNFPEKTLILDEGYLNCEDNSFVKWSPEVYVMILNGWKLIAQEENTTTICLFYNINNDDELVHLMMGQNIFQKVNLENALYTYDVKTIKTEMNLSMQENDFICVARGKIKINGLEKKQKEWVRSTNAQQFNIVNMSDNESIIFLSKPR